MLHNVNNNQVCRLNSGSSPFAVNPGENSYKPLVQKPHGWGGEHHILPFPLGAFGVSISVPQLSGRPTQIPGYAYEPQNEDG